jgi:hypothetical protein
MMTASRSTALRPAGGIARAIPDDRRYAKLPAPARYQFARTASRRSGEIDDNTGARRAAAPMSCRPTRTIKQYVRKRMVPLAGIEPARPCGHLILSQARLPIPPQGHERAIIPGGRVWSTAKCGYFSGRQRARQAAMRNGAVAAPGAAGGVDGGHRPAGDATKAGDEGRPRRQARRQAKKADACVPVP